MFNEFRSWLRPLDEREALAEREDVRFVESRRSLCYVLDEDAGSARTLADILQGSGLETNLFTNGAAFTAGLVQQTPDLVFLDVTSEANEAIDAVFALGERSYGGSVQLMGGGPVQVMDTVKRMGERHALQMLPLLRKPFDSGAIRQILQDQKLAGAPAAPLKVDLNEALSNNWIEFWYQPKIDLRKKQIAGVETFARVRHPHLGTLPPGAFMPGADENSVTELTQRALTSALTAATNFSQIGINLRLAVNISLSALVALPIAEMVREYGPKKPGWPGLILDVTEEQIVADLPLVRGMAERLSNYNIKLAIDDFGSGKLSLAKLHELSFSELKLDRTFVTNCGTERSNATVCKTVVDLAHNFGSVAVAIGVEKPADVHVLQGMGCDLGQGFLFAQPMPEERLVAMLRERAVVPKRAAAPQMATSRA
jgi:EAL domain-containing protein (putative c-di-GMP-specific phosphodiesterase class I)/CheY-like chemotaxis protein